MLSGAWVVPSREKLHMNYIKLYLFTWTQFTRVPLWLKDSYRYSHCNRVIARGHTDTAVLSVQAFLWCVVDRNQVYATAASNINYGQQVQ